MGKTFLKRYCHAGARPHIRGNRLQLPPKAFDRATNLALKLLRSLREQHIRERIGQCRRSRCSWTRGGDADDTRLANRLYVDGSKDLLTRQIRSKTRSYSVGDFARLR